MWELRECAVKTINTKYFKYKQLIEQLFVLYQELLTSINTSSISTRIILRILIKSYSHFKAIYSLNLDGQAQEGGAIARLIIEANELLTYIYEDETDNDRIKQIYSGLQPSYGKIAKINNSELNRDIKNYLSQNSSHFNISVDSMKHLFKENKGEVMVNIFPKFDSNSLKENLIVQILLMSINIKLVTSCLIKEKELDREMKDYIKLTTDNVNLIINDKIP